MHKHLKRAERLAERWCRRKKKKRTKAWLYIRYTLHSCHPKNHVNNKSKKYNLKTMVYLDHINQEIEGGEVHE